MNKRTTLSKIKKMIDKVEEIKRLYEELSEETKEKLTNEFSWENKPLAVINRLEIILDDCLEIIKEANKKKLFRKKTIEEIKNKFKV